MKNKDVERLYSKYIMNTYTHLPISLVKGRGSRVWDFEQNEYLDLFPGWGVSILGHSPSKVVSHVRNQAGKIMHISNNYYNHLQAKLAQKDIWMRGAISFGEVYFDKESNLIVGKGLVKAYLLESEEIYPRVIIDTSIILRIASDRRLFFNFINPNPDNFNDKLKLVHNYFQFIEDDSFFIAYAHRILLDSIKKRNIHLIYKKIKKNLYSDSKHFKKFLWVKNYFSGVLLELSNNWEITFNNSINNKELINQQYIKRWWHKFNEL